MKQRKPLAIFKPPFAVLIVPSLLLLGGFFFWFEYRPSMVRARCSTEAEKMGKDEFVYEIIYRHCLRKHGIEYTEQKE